MLLQINDVSADDLLQVLSLNESEVPNVGRIDMQQVQWFAAQADYFRVAGSNGALSGFLIALRPGSSYASPNYRWFCNQYEDFAYVDRIAVAQAARGRGLGALLYDDLTRRLPSTVRTLACEVNIRPANELSMQFHTKLGFTQVGTLDSEHGDKQVALLIKNL